MRDGRTRNLRQTKRHVSFEEFRREFTTSLAIVEGTSAGTIAALTTSPFVIGRAPAAQLSLHDDSLSREHAVVEYAGGGFRVRDLGSTNGVRVRGRRVDACDLEPGDRFELGDITFQFLLDVNEDAPEAYELALDDET